MIEEDPSPYNILSRLLHPLHVAFSSLTDLEGIVIDRDDLLQVSLIQYYYSLIPFIKQHYYSDMLSCLHQNSLQKQRFPAICMLRQMCKLNGIRMVPKVISMGYEKSTGKKIVKRLFTLTLEDSPTEITETTMENDV